MFLATRELRRAGRRVAVEPQVFDLLAHLLRHRDRVVSREELIAEVWKGRHVSDATLDSRLSAARRAIGDSGSAQALIRTAPRRGVRFVGAVSEEAGPDTAERPQGGSRSPCSLAVARFSARPASADSEAVAAALSEALLAELPAALPELRVHPAGPAAAFALEGGLEGWGGRLRARIRLVRAGGGETLAAWSHEAAPEAAPALLDGAVARVAAGLERALLPALEASLASDTDAAAFALRTRAALLALAPRNAARTLQAFRAAAALGPGQAASWAGVALTLLTEQLEMWPRTDAEAAPGEAEEAAERAVALDPGLAAAQLALGLALRAAGRHEAALPALERAAALAPHHLPAQAQAAAQRVYLGDPAAALPALERCLALAPREGAGGGLLALRGFALSCLGRTEDAIADHRRAALERPEAAWPALNLVALLGLSGRPAEARMELAALLRRRPGLADPEQRPGARPHPALTAPALRAWRGAFLDALRRAGLPPQGLFGGLEDYAECLDP